MWVLGGARYALYMSGGQVSRGFDHVEPRERDRRRPEQICGTWLETRAGKRLITGNVR